MKPNLVVQKLVTVRVALLIGALLATVGLSPVHADPGGIPAQVATLQQAVQMLQQQVARFIDQAKAQNMAITQLTAAIEGLPPAWDKILPANDGEPDGCNSSRFTCVMPDANFPNGAAVRDNETALVWERSPDLAFRTWSDALRYCANRVVGGRVGFRLPSMPELATLMDPNNPGPIRLPPGHPFTNVQPSAYRSATTDANVPADAWAVSIGGGVVGTGAKADPDPVWCVRGAMNADAY